MRWISFSLGTVALAILFGVAHRGVSAWIEPELRAPRIAAAADLAMAVGDSGASAVRDFVEAREDLASLVAARLAGQELRPEAAVAEVELGLPGVSGVVVTRAGAVEARSGEAFEPPEGPDTSIEDGTLSVARAVGPWQVAAHFATGALVFDNVAGPQSALLQWRAGETSLAQIGPPRLAGRRSEAEALGGVLNRVAPVEGTRIEVIALPPSSGVGTRLQEGIMWLGLGAFGILALTILLVPAGASSASSAEARTRAPARAESDATPDPSLTARTVEPEPVAAGPSPEPASPAPIPEGPRTDPEATPPPEAPATAPPLPSEPEERPQASEDVEEERMAALGFGAPGAHPLADDEEEEGGPSALPSEPMHSASLPSLRPGAEDEAEGDGWSPALADTLTQPQWPTPEPAEPAAPADASLPPSQPQAPPAPPESAPAAPPAPPERPRQPRDASLVAGAQMDGEDGVDITPYDPAHYQQVYQAFVEARARVGSPATGVNLQAFSRKLESSEQGLIEKHGCRAVRFDVVERDGKVTLRPRLVR